MVILHCCDLDLAISALKEISGLDIPVSKTLLTEAEVARSSVEVKSGGWYCLLR